MAAVISFEVLAIRPTTRLLLPPLLLLLLLQVCRIHCATSNPTSVVLGKTSDEAVVRRTEPACSWS
jgi:hypothetical protein